MVNQKKISVVIPCYNEEEGIEAVLRAMPGFVDEIVVVDNNSTDRTAEVAEDLGACVVKEPRRGYGRAYKTGLKEASGEIIVTMDGDFTYPTFAIEYLLNVFFEDELDFLSARRIPVEVSKKFNNFQRYMGNLFLTSVLWMLYRQNIKDSQSGMWIFWKRILPALNLTQDGMAFSEELKLEAFANPFIKAREVPIQFKYLERVGDSKLHLWRDGMKNLAFLFKKRYRDSTKKKRIMKIFDFFSIYFRLRAGKIVAMSFNVTNRCNCKCPMCAIWQKENGPELSVEQIEKIFKEVANAGIKVVEITGGEPFLRKDIFDILDILEDLGLYYTINTHGGLLDPEILTRLAGYRRILDFAVSLDTLDPETYRRIRGIDQLGRVLENLKLVRAILKNTIVKLSMTVSRLNYHEFPTILSFARENEFYLSVFPVNLGPRFEHRNDAEELAPNRKEKEEMAALFHQLARMRKKGEILCEYSKFYEGAAQYVETGETGPCGAGKLFLDLHADGKLSVCNDLPPFADLTMTSLQDALEAVDKQAGRIRHCCASTPCYYTCSFGISNIAEHSTSHILELVRIAGVRKVWSFFFPGRAREARAVLPEQQMAREDADSVKE